MDFAALLSALNAVSIVAWFAVLIVMFTVVIGFGIFHARHGKPGHGTGPAATVRKPRPRDTATPRAPKHAALTARKSSPRSHRKEYT